MRHCYIILCEECAYDALALFLSMYVNPKGEMGDFECEIKSELGKIKSKIF